MRDGWTETTLGDIAEYINGYPFKPSDLGDEGTAVIRIKQLLDPMEKVDRTTVEVPERCVLSNGDIVFSWSGTLAVRVWNRGSAYLNQHLFRVIEKTGVSHEWLPLVIDHAIDDLVEKSHGTTMKHITKQTLLPHQVLLPPLAEQKRIVDVVSYVDAYIDALQQQVDTARAARKAVLNELLSTSGDGWSECSLGDIAEVLDRMRKPISGSEREKRLGNVPYYGATGQAGWIDKPIFDEELVLLGEDAIDFLNPDVHKAYLVSGPSWVNNHAHVLRAKREKVLSFFLMESLNAVDYSQFVAFGTRSKLTQGSMMGISVQVPPLEEQKQIVEIVSSIDDVIQSTEQAVTVAKNLRSGLLSDLLSGEHEIPASYDLLLGAA